MTMAKWTALFLAIACFLSFIWAIRCFFASAGSMAKDMRIISICGSGFMLLHLGMYQFSGSVSLRLLGIACSLYLTSLLLFWWAVLETRRERLSLAFSEDLPMNLYQAGPYRMVRHPFYVSYTLCWLGGVFANAQWFLLITLIVMFALYYRAAKFEEAKFIVSPLRGAYEDYQSKTGMFIPKPMKALSAIWQIVRIRAFSKRSVLSENSVNKR
jgi:protein-S-isoprenylcysteine O-methyltransferase Ste14